MRALFLMLAAATAGCAGYSFGQTAKTVAAGNVELKVAGGIATNKNDNLRSERDDSNLTVDPSVRVGVGANTDVGINPFLTFGGELDAKHDFLPRQSPYGLAIRGGVAYAVDERDRIYAAVVGPIASWRILSVLTPYLSLGVRNLWIDRRVFTKPPEGAQFVDRKGYGNGLVQAVLGVRLGGKHVAGFAEYGRWMPLWNDPGDFYKLVLTHTLSAGIAFCIGSECG